MLELYKGIFRARRAWNAYNVGRYRDTGKLKWQRFRWYHYRPSLSSNIKVHWNTKSTRILQTIAGKSLVRW